MFLEEKISYLDIVRVVEECCAAHRAELVEAPTLEEIVHYDQVSPATLVCVCLLAGTGLGAVLGGVPVRWVGAALPGGRGPRLLRRFHRWRMPVVPGPLQRALIAHSRLCRLPACSLCLAVGAAARGGAGEQGRRDGGVSAGSVPSAP